MTNTFFNVLTFESLRLLPDPRLDFPDLEVELLGLEAEA